MLQFNEKMIERERDRMNKAENDKKCKKRYHDNDNSDNDISIDEG